MFEIVVKRDGLNPRPGGSPVESSRDHRPVAKGSGSVPPPLPVGVEDLNLVAHRLGFSGNHAVRAPAVPDNQEHNRMTKLEVPQETANTSLLLVHQFELGFGWF